MDEGHTYIDTADMTQSAHPSVCWAEADEEEGVEPAYGLPFITALRSFKRRVLYGNTIGDCICPYATASLVHYNFLGTVEEGDDNPTWLAHHNDDAGIACNELTTLQAPGLETEEVFPEGTVQRKIVEALRSQLSWERFDLMVPPSQHNLILGAHCSAAIAALSKHALDELTAVDVKSKPVVEAGVALG